MTFLTYAQNHEDVLLWRALKDIKNGFYIDVGANDPEVDSVTKAFYDLGWWGINIEPMPSYRQAFLDARPRDINLTVAAGSQGGHITLFEVPSMNGWASTERSVADAHRVEGYDVIETDVPLRPLKDICEEHVRGDIHFLKIDVEGFEAEVLRGMDFSRWRPWIVVIEATMPNSSIPNHQVWEHMITGNDYHFAYFDGLNRYYVAAEHIALRELLAVQPNVFDGFISHHLDKSRRNNAWLEEMVKAANVQAAAAEVRTHQALEQLDAAHAQTAEAEVQIRQALEQADAANARTDSLVATINAVLERALAAQAAQQEAEHQATTALAKAAEAHIGRHETALWAQELEQRVIALEGSWGWRLSMRVGRLRSRLRPRYILSRLVYRFMQRLRRLNTNQMARRILMLLKRICPGLVERLLQLGKPPAPPVSIAATEAVTVTFVEAARTVGVSTELSMLPTSVRLTLADLIHAIHPSSK